MKRREFIRNSVMAMAGVVGGSIFEKTAFAANSDSSVNKIKNGSKKMKILVLTGSPRKNGNSNTLADYFIKGAVESGHEVVRFDSAFKNVHPCIACNSCGMNGDCVFQDDFNEVIDNIVDADMVVFATPMYYFGFSTQLKTVIDRFYSINGKIHVPKKSALLMTYANTASSEAEPIKKHYEVLLNYLGWSDVGQIIAPGMWPAGAINGTKYTTQAYELGKSLV